MPFILGLAIRVVLCYVDFILCLTVHVACCGNYNCKKTSVLQQAVRKNYKEGFSGRSVEESFGFER